MGIAKEQLLDVFTAANQVVVSASILAHYIEEAEKLCEDKKLKLTAEQQQTKLDEYADMKKTLLEAVAQLP